MPKSVAVPVMCVERMAPPDKSVITVLCIPMMKHNKNKAKDGKTVLPIPMFHCEVVSPNKPNISR